MVFTVVTTLTGIALGLASLYIIRYATNTADANGEYLSVLAWLLVLVGAYLADSLFGQLAGIYITPQFDEQVNKRLKRKILEKAAECDLECYENPEFYEKYTCAMIEGPGRCDAVFGAVIGLIRDIIEFFGAGLIVILADPIMLIFVVIPLIFGFLKAGGQKTGFKLHNEKMKVERRNLSRPHLLSECICKGAAHHRYFQADYSAVQRGNLRFRKDISQIRHKACALLCVCRYRRHVSR